MILNKAIQSIRSFFRKKTVTVNVYGIIPIETENGFAIPFVYSGMNRYPKIYDLYGLPKFEQRQFRFRKSIDSIDSLAQSAVDKFTINTGIMSESWRMVSFSEKDSRRHIKIFVIAIPKDPVKAESDLEEYFGDALIFVEKSVKRHLPMNLKISHLKIIANLDSKTAFHHQKQVEKFESVRGFFWYLFSIYSEQFKESGEKKKLKFELIE